jgi:SnoaL-like domain
VTDDTEAKLAITEVLYRYCRALDRMDRVLADTIWHPGGTADYGPTFQGPAAGLLDTMWAGHAKLLGHSHQVTNVLIEVRGDRAASEAYVTGTLWDLTATGAMSQLVAVGRYLDRWSRRDGRWAIDHRQFIYDAVFTPAPADPTAPSASVFRQLAARRDPRQTAGRRDPGDPSYELLTGPNA